MQADRPVDFSAMQRTLVWISLGLVGIYALLFYPLCHWLLVFPGIATDQPKTFVVAESIISGHRGRFFMVIFVVFAVLYGAEIGFSWLSSNILAPLFFGSEPLLTDPSAPSTGIAMIAMTNGFLQLQTFLQWTLGLLASAFFASALSLSYREMKDIADGAPESPGV